jgi:hypothetical protein
MGRAFRRRHGVSRSHRIRSLVIIGAGLALLHALVPDAGARETSLYLVALPIGYGHLLGSCLFARARMRPTGLEAAFASSSALTLLCGYTWALHVEALQLVVLAPMLLVSAWHVVENDLALARAYRSELRLDPIPRDAAHHAIALVATAVLGLLALATPTGAYYLTRQWGAALPFQLTTVPDLATAVLMYHAVSWILFFVDRAKALPEPEASRLRWRLLWLHAVPLALNAGLYLWVPAVHVYAAAPTLYLFGSVLHVVQTACVRGLEPRPPARFAWAQP